MHDRMPWDLAFTSVACIGAESAFKPWAAIIDNLPVPTYVCDRAGTLVLYNGLAAQAWGHSPAPGAAAPRYFGTQAIFGSDGAPLQPWQTPAYEVLHSGKAVHGREFCFEGPEGRRRFVVSNVNPLVDGAGAMIGAVGCFNDVIERPIASDSPAASDQRLRALMDALPLALYTTDRNGHLTYFNRAAIALCGREPRPEHDRWCVMWRLRRPDGRPLSAEEYPTAVAIAENQAIHDFEALAEREDGSFVPLLVFSTPLRNALGEPAGVVNMLVDISEGKQSEARRKLLLNELNHRVKNNMQMLHALLALAERETVGEEARAALRTATQRVGAMAAAQQALYESDDPAAIDPRRFLAAVCASAQRVLRKPVEIEIDGPVGPIANDRAVPLALILNELLMEAAKSGRDGAARGAAEARLARAGNAIVLSVEDSGPSFMKGDAVTRSSGLGLVAGLARQLGGSIEASDSQPARCSVRIPDSLPGR